MMKKIIVIGIAVMLMGMAVAAQAAIDTMWCVELQAFGASGSGSTAGTLVLGSVTQSNVMDWNVAGANGDSRDSELTDESPDGATVVAIDMPTKRTSGSALWVTDKRPTMVANQTQIWNIELYTPVAPGYADSTMVLKVWQPSKISTLFTGLDTATGGYSVFQLKQGNEVLWDFIANSSLNNVGTGTAGAPLFTKSYDATGGRAGAYDLQLVVTTVPEPGSIVAMLSGLVGLAGYGIRRRK
jgi:hypothetical protein